MTKLEQIEQILGVTVDNVWGPKCQAALDQVIHPPPAVSGPFNIRVDGVDLVCDNTEITAFGGWGTGINDTGDNGGTSSGVNTKTQAIIGVALPLDARDMSVSSAVHKALDGSPVPHLKNPDGTTYWHIQVQVKIGDIVFTPRDGLVDLGPNLETKRGLDLSVLAAALFAPSMALNQIANSFKMQGSYRILGGAKVAGLV